MPKQYRPSVQKHFSQHLKRLRTDQGLTLTALAERIGVSTAYVSLIEAGARQPSRAVVLRMAQFFFEAGQPQTDQLLMLAGLSPICLPLSQTAPAENHPVKNIQTQLTLNRQLIRCHKYAAIEPQIFERLKQFNQGVIFQLLLAQMQLCTGAYPMALELLQDALTTNPEPSDLEQAEIQAHLALTYWLWSGSTASAGSRLHYLSQARTYSQQALKLRPEDITLQEEYAHVCFEYAEAQDSDPTLWQTAVAALKQVIYSPRLEQLESQRRRETNTRLVWALARAGELKTARLLLGFLRNYYHDDHLIEELWSITHQAEHPIAFKQAPRTLSRSRSAYKSLEHLQEQAPGA